MLTAPPSRHGGTAIGDFGGRSFCTFRSGLRSSSEHQPSYSLLPHLYQDEITIALHLGVGKAIQVPQITQGQYPTPDSIQVTAYSLARPPSLALHLAAHGDRVLDSARQYFPGTLFPHFRTQ